MLRDLLVDHFKYPKALKGLQFDPNFAVRGLHFGSLSRILGKYSSYVPPINCANLLCLQDISNGWLMKIDSFANIQLSTVHGKQAFCIQLLP
jgi:hypothetical protein